MFCLRIWLDMSGDPLLTIIIPTYNEAIRLPETLLKISSYLKRAGLVCQILVVDDGSTDNTCSLVEELQPQMPCLQLLRSDRNYGKGHAVKMGVLHSTGSYVLMSDADLSTPIE